MLPVRSGSRHGLGLHRRCWNPRADVKAGWRGCGGGGKEGRGEEEEEVEEGEELQPRCPEPPGQGVTVP